MTESIFPIHRLDRKHVHWEKFLYNLTPVEKVDGIWFKREDKFHPLGYGNINGTKCRQCIWLIYEQAFKKGKYGVIHGAVSGSPQHPMVATICRHYGLRVIDIVGTKEIEGHKTLEIAKNMGAEFIFSNVGYAKTLESKARELQRSKYTDMFHMETNITVNHETNAPELVEAFHEVGMHQVTNLPTSIDTLIIPAGSCNSVTSVLYGIAKFRPKNIKKIILIGVGNFGSKHPEYIRNRLNVIGKVSEIDMDEVFDYRFFKQDEKPSSLFMINNPDYTIEHYDAQGGCREFTCKHCVKIEDNHVENGYSTYNDLVFAQHGEIVFHPRYEAKMWNFMMHHPHIFDKYMNERSCVWIIGGSVDQN